MKGLSSEAQEVLGRICAAYAAQPFPVDKAESLRPAALCRAEQELALQELRQAGLLEMRQKIWGEKLYQIPSDKLAAIQECFFPNAPHTVEDGSVILQEAAGRGLIGELFRAMLFIACEGLPLTGKGAIHSKKMSRLGAGLFLQEEHLAGLIPSGAAGTWTGTCPLPALFMVDLLLAMGLASRNNTAVVLQSEVQKAWFRLTEPEMTSVLYHMMLNRYGPQEPELQHFRYMISTDGYAPGQWYSLSDVMQAMAAFGMCMPGPQLEAGCQAWLRALTGFGWCELGCDAEGVTCFRWTNAKPLLQSGRISGYTDSQDVNPMKGAMDAREDTKFIVQPDFEILVLPETAYDIRWRLAGCAELLHSDDLWSFRLTQKRLEAAAEQGQSPESVINWLASHAEGGLPAQVEQSMRHWAKGIGRTELSDVILLACRHEGDGEAIAAHPRLQNSLTRVGPLHFIVRPDELARVRKELAGAGMAPPRLTGGRDEEPQTQVFMLSEDKAPAAEYKLPDNEKPNGLFDPKVTLKLLPFVPAEAEELMLQGRAGMPQMWLKEWRQYHSTTAQKVMEQALEWGVKVRLALDERVCDFIPGRITANPWRVTGYLLDSDTADGQETELAAGDWREMKLILPRERRNSSSSGAAGYVMIK